jgi:hypothetical protein
MTDLTEHHIQTVNGRSDRPALLRFTGRLLAGDGDLDVYETDTGRIVAVWSESGYDTWDNTVEFSSWLDNPMRDNQGQAGEHVLGDAAAVLGIPEVVDL